MHVQDDTKGLLVSLEGRRAERNCTVASLGVKKNSVSSASTKMKKKLKTIKSCLHTVALLCVVVNTLCRLSLVQKSSAVSTKIQRPIVQKLKAVRTQVTLAENKMKGGKLCVVGHEGKN